MGVLPPNTFVNRMPPATTVQTAPAVVQQKAPSSEAFYNLVVDGDLGKLTADQRVAYLKSVTESLGLNPMTRPFGLIRLDNKVTLYALKEASTQLAKRDCVTVTLGDYIYVKERNILMVKAEARTPDGRITDEVAAIAIGDKVMGDMAANAYMKLATKAKRRAVLAHCGLGILDESELETIKNVRHIDEETTTKKELDKGPEPIPAVASPVHEEQTRENEPQITHSDAFSYQDTGDRQWLINTLKRELPTITRADAIALCGTFVNATSKAEIEADLKKRVSK